MRRYAFSGLLLLPFIVRYLVMMRVMSSLCLSSLLLAFIVLGFSATLAGLAFLIAVDRRISQLSLKNQYLPIHHPKKRRDEGIWQDAPIAVVDKSTLGKLLASRMRREPGLHVVVRGQDATPEHFRLDVLYDPEVDG